MKKIFILLLLFVGVKAYSQIPYEMGAIKVDSVYYNESADWIDSITTSTTLSGATNSQLPTALSVKTYVNVTSADAAHDSLVTPKANIVSLQDSLDTHTDSLQSHNTRLKAIESGDVGYDISIYPDANPDTVITTFVTGGERVYGYYKRAIINEADSIAKHTDSLQLHNTRIITNFNSIVSKQDSLNKHTDTLQSHDTRLKFIENGGVAGDIDLDDVASYTFLIDSANTLKGIAYGSGDSVAFNQKVVLGDSLYMSIFGGATDVFLTLTSKGAVDTATTVAADTMLTHPIQTLEEQLENTKNGEMIWYVVHKNGTIIEHYGLQGVGAMKKINAFQGMIEVSLRHTREVQKELETEKKKNNALENRILILEELMATQIKEKQILHVKKAIE